ncbi:MAG TPA: hypothetical protein VF152_00365 [Acidimicrobiia bacterium]
MTALHAAAAVALATMTATVAAARLAWGSQPTGPVAVLLFGLFAVAVLTALGAAVIGVDGSLDRLPTIDPRHRRSRTHSRRERLVMGLRPARESVARTSRHCARRLGEVAHSPRERRRAVKALESRLAAVATVLGMPPNRPNRHHA